MRKNFLMLVVAASLLLSLAGCRKPSPEYVWDGVITGPDYRKCACCGGWFITIADEEYSFWSIPANSGLDLENEKFPLKVKLDWTKPSDPCPFNRIEVLRIKKQ